MRYWTELKGLMVKGQAPDCFALQWMKNQEGGGIDDFEGGFIAGSQSSFLLL